MLNQTTILFMKSGKFSPTTRAFACLLMGGAAIALSPILIRLADVGPLSSAFWRAALAAPVLLAWMVWEARQNRMAISADSGPKESARPHMQVALIAAGLAFAGDLAFWHLSVIYTSVANATLLSNLAPLFVTLAGWLWFAQRCSRGFLGAMAIAFCGVALLIGPDFNHGGSALWGDFLGLVTALFYGAYMLAVKHARRTASTARVMATSTSITAASLLVVALDRKSTRLNSSHT